MDTDDTTQDQEDGLETVTVGTAAQPLDFPDEAINLATYLLDIEDERVQKFVKETTPAQVIDTYEEDKEARSGWMEKYKERAKLFLGDLSPKTEPWKNCANMHDPVLLERLLRLSHRVYAELFQPNAPIFDVLLANNGDQEQKDRAEILSLHENWQFTKDIPDFKQQIRRAIQEFFRDGDCIFHSYFDMETGKNRHEHLSPEEFVYPYTWKTARTDMSDVPRKTRVWRKYKRELESLAEQGYYDARQVAAVLKNASEGSNDTGVEHPVKDQMDAYEGIDRTEAKTDAPFMLLEQHTWVRFPGDRRDSPVRIVVEQRSRVVLGIYKREFDDPEDRVRFDRETAEFQAYVGQVQKFVQIQQMEQDLLTRLQAGDIPPDDAMAVAQQTRMQSPPPPVAPEWMQTDESGGPQPPEPCKQRVIEQFSHGVCIENPDGSHGLGIGSLLMPHQQAINILLNQFVDGSTLANSSTYFIHENAKFDPGVKTVAPNTLNRIRGLPLDSLDKAIVKVPTTPPNPQILGAIKDQKDAADGVANAPDVLSGEKDGPETFRGQATRVEQAVKQLTVFAANFVEMLSNIARLNSQLNAQYLPDWKLVSVLDPRLQQMRQIKVGRAMYQDDYQIAFTADLRFASKAQRIAEADDVLGMLTKGIPPQIASIIFQGPQIFAAAVRKCLQARQQYDMLPLVSDDQAIQAKLQQQAMAAQAAAMPPGMPPGQGGGPPPPSVPTGMPNQAPGAQIPQSAVQHGVPAESAPSK